jgi:DNA-binding CsgD family transcriptional regulator
MEQVHPQDTFLLGYLLDANRSINGWQQFLDAFRQHFNVHSCHLYIANRQTLAPRFQDWSGAKPSEIELKTYMENYFETDYTHLAILRGEPNTWYASNLMPNQAQIESAPAFTQWAIPNNIHCVSGCTLFTDGDSSCVFVSNRNKQQEKYSTEELNRFSALGPYIEKAIQLRVKLAEHKKDRLRIKSVLNHFRLPVATLNEFGEVIAQNRLMDEFLDQQANIRLHQGKHLTLLDQDADKQLQLSIAQSVSTAKGHSLNYSSQPITISDSQQKSNFSLGFQELAEEDSDSGEIFIGAMVYAVAPNLLLTVDKQQLRDLFELTQAESHVVQLFSSGMPLKEIAVCENKSVNTVREQVQNSYKKTNTKNQLELISLLASLPVAHA